MSPIPRNHLPLACILMLAVAANAAAPAGRKYLLAVGVNAYASSPLRGCVNDATGMSELLIGSFGFDGAASALLTDQTATRANILGAIDRYAGLIEADDLFVFFYSGHGSLFPDQYSLERDETQALDLSYLRARGLNIPDGYYDSTLVPIDAGQSSARPWGNQILDDELYLRFSRMTARGATVILISDSCHSGSLARTLEGAGTPKFLDPETAIGARLDTLTAPKGAAKSEPRELHGRYLALTSSQDNQTSIDSVYENRNQSLFTYALRKVIGRGNSLNYQTLFNRGSEIVRTLSKGEQVPRLDARFYRGSLNEPAFAVSASSASAGAVRLRLIVRGRGGEPISGSSFALFRPEITSVPKGIESSNTLAILRTTANGEVISDPINLKPGEYLIKTVAVGYVTFTGRARIIERGGVATLLVVLDPE